MIHEDQISAALYDHDIAALSGLFSNTSQLKCHEVTSVCVSVCFVDLAALAWFLVEGNHTTNTVTFPSQL